MLFKFKLICLTLLISFGLNANEFEIVERNGKFGLKNTISDLWSVEPIYEAIGWSNKETAIAGNLIGAKLNEKWALITTDGSKVTQHIFVELFPYAQNSFIASKREQYSIRLKFGLVDFKGKEVLAFENDRLDAYGDFLIASKTTAGNKKAALLNKQGKAILDFEYSAINFVSDDKLSVTNTASKSALFNLNGEALTSFDYESLKPYKDSFYEVTYYGRKGLIDENGNLIIPPIYKDFRLENSVASGLTFTQWDVFEGAKFKQSLFFDDVFELSTKLLAVNSRGTSGIINELNEYQYYKEEQIFSESLKSLTVVQNSTNQYYGVIDARGNSVIPINYDSIYLTPNYIAASIDKPKGNDWQLFDYDGKAVSVFSYDLIEDFGRVYKAKRNGKSGLLNELGDEISPFLYDDIQESQNGLSVVEYQNRKGVIDQQGHWVITPYNDSISIGTRRIYIEQGSQKKLAEFNGHISSKSYDSLILLSRSYGLKNEDGIALYNFANDRLLEPLYDTLLNVNDDLYALYRDSRIFFYRPSDGQDYELDSEITDILEFAEGYIRIKKDGQYGFVDDNGKLRIANRYQDAQPYSEGLAAVKLIGNWGYINKSEDIIIQPSFEAAEAFSNRLAIVQEGDFFGLISPTTELILPTNYNAIKRYKDYIILESNGLKGLADADGNLIKDCQYDEILKIAKNTFQVQKGDKLGVIDIEGTDLVPISYSQIKVYGNRFYGALPPQWERIKTSN